MTCTSWFLGSAAFSLTLGVAAVAHSGHSTPAGYACNGTHAIPQPRNNFSCALAQGTEMPVASLTGSCATHINLPNVTFGYTLYKYSYTGSLYQDVAYVAQGGSGTSSVCVGASNAKA